MRWETNMVEKKKDKTPEQLSKVQMGNMREKEFRISIIKMIQDLKKEWRHRMRRFKKCLTNRQKI